MGDPRNRRTHLLVAIVAAVALSATSCVSVTFGGDEIEGSGNIETREYSLDSFDEIEIANAFDADVTIAADADQKIEITADDNLFEEIEVELDRDTLKISVRGGTNLKVSTALKATIVAPSLSAVEVSGAARADVRAGGSALSKLEASGASRIDVIDLETAELKIDVSGASSVIIAGTSGGSVELDVSGASEADLRELPITTADVDISGASNVELGPAEDVEGSASGASHLRVASDTRIDVETSGSSSVQR
jgi:hypothetical protein